MAMNSKVHIRAGVRNGKSFLQECFYTPPFKIADITENGHGKNLRLMVMNTSPGVLDGDEYAISISLDAGTFLQLETQSYQRLFQMKKEAVQTMEVAMGKRSSLHYLPHPLVPHKHASFTAKNKLYLAENCTLCWGEIVTSGRNLRGESFLFTRFHSVTDIYFHNKLVVRENLLMRPGMDDLTTMGQLEGYTHQATLIYLNEQAVVPDLIKQICACLQVEEKIEYGCTKLSVNGLLVRILGRSGEGLHDSLKKIAFMLEQSREKTFHAQ
jgi:urease accessory protein